MVDKSAKKQAKQEAKAARRAEKAGRSGEKRQARSVLSRAEMAAQLRALASQIESGTFVLGDKELPLPEHADFELSYKPQRQGGHQIEVEIEWGKGQSVALLPVE